MCRLPPHTPAPLTAFCEMGCFLLLQEARPRRGRHCCGKSMEAHATTREVRYVPPIPSGPSVFFSPTPRNKVTDPTNGVLVGDYSVHPEFAIEPITSQETTFRHSGWTHRRRLIWQSFFRVRTNGAVMDKFKNCGSGLWLKMNAEGTDMKLSANCCHNRWCIPCQTARAARISARVEDLIKKETTRFMTLTLRHSKTPLIDQIRRLYHSFNLLRRRSFWNDHVTGGSAFLEIKLSDRDGLWHVHLHCLITGTWMPQKELSFEWHAVTGDSSIVDIRPIDTADGRARYVTKYVTKPADQSVFANTDKLDEMVVSLKGRRLCFTFGSWRGEKLDDIPEDDSCWHSVGPLDSIRREAGEGVESSVRLWEAACRKWPQLLHVFETPRTQAPEDY